VPHALARPAKFIGRGMQMIARSRKASLAAASEPSSRSYKIMLSKLVMKTQRKMHHMECAMNNITAGMHRKFDAGYCLSNALWYHENCVGARGCEIFICGECNIKNC
jgi:hypothetical protein